MIWWVRYSHIHLVWLSVNALLLYLCADLCDAVYHGVICMFVIYDHHGQRIPDIAPASHTHTQTHTHTLCRFQVREGVVVFLGTLARHLPADDPKRSVVVDTLISVLATPSEGVQVSNGVMHVSILTASVCLLQCGHAESGAS